MHKPINLNLPLRQKYKRAKNNLANIKRREPLRLLICTWGDPHSWREVEYAWTLGTEECKIRSRTTLPLIFDVFKPDKVIILTLDTLADSLQGEYQEYVELLLGVERYLKEDFISRACPEVLNIAKIAVLPGVGRFKNGYEFFGEAADFYHACIKELAATIPSSGNIEVCLDLSHGVNFMPTLTYRAITELLEIHAMMAEASILVVNSDPVTPATNHANMNIIERRKVEPSFRFQRVEEPSKMLGYDKCPEKAQALKKELDFFSISKRELNCFLASIENGFPLMAYRFMPDSDKLFGCIETAYVTFMRHVSVSKRRVERLLSLKESFAGYVKAWMLSRLLRGAGFAAKCEVTLKEMHELRKNVFAKNRRINAVVSNDLRELESDSSKFSEEWMPWSSYCAKEFREFDQRVVYAHSGLPYAAVEVRRRDGEVEVRYTEERLCELMRHIE